MYDQFGRDVEEIQEDIEMIDRRIERLSSSSKRDSPHSSGDKRTSLSAPVKKEVKQMETWREKLKETENEKMAKWQAGRN